MLDADFPANAGRPPDRAALISVGGVAPQESSATVAPTRHVERDVLPDRVVAQRGRANHEIERKTFICKESLTFSRHRPKIQSAFGIQARPIVSDARAVPLTLDVGARMSADPT